MNIMYAKMHYYLVDIRKLREFQFYPKLSTPNKLSFSFIKYEEIKYL